MSPVALPHGLNGVFRCSAERATALQRAAESRRFITASIDLPRQVRRATLFEGFSSALRFPEWFGGNWDALTDCITDLSWLDEKGYLIILRGFTAAFSRESDDWNTLADILNDAAIYWHEAGTPFCVLVEDGPTSLQELPAA